VVNSCFLFPALSTQAEHRKHLTSNPEEKKDGSTDYFLKAGMPTRSGKGFISFLL
jgi:hypothetical protein